jgi:hypothetical protein
MTLLTYHNVPKDLFCGKPRWGYSGGRWNHGLPLQDATCEPHHWFHGACILMRRTYCDSMNLLQILQKKDVAEFQSTHTSETACQISETPNTLPSQNLCFSLRPGNYINISMYQNGNNWSCHHSSTLPRHVRSSDCITGWQMNINLPLSRS